MRYTLMHSFILEPLPVNPSKASRREREVESVQPERKASRRQPEVEGASTSLRYA